MAGSGSTGISRSPAVLHFNCKVQSGKIGNSRSSGPFVELPRSIATEYTSAGWERVEGTINAHPFRTALESGSNGECCFKLNNAMLKGASVKPGDTANVILLGPESEPVPPADLQAAFDNSPQAHDVWLELNIHNRLDWIRWIEDARKPETRARRIFRTIDQLSEGKRRACCVNVYQYMQDLIAARGK